MKKLLTLALAIALVCALICSCSAPAEEAQSAEAKTITVCVTANGETEKISLETSAETLREALEKEGLIAGSESDYGMFVETVNGITANADNQEWWCITIGGKSAATGVDEIIIEDGASYEFTLTVGW